MLDPPRESARTAIRTCARANIRTVMITGDHKNTAAAIAKQAGLLRGKKAMTGDELDALSDAQLGRLPGSVHRLCTGQARRISCGWCVRTGGVARSSP